MPPPSANATITDLQVSQAFTNEAATLKGSWDRVTGTAFDGSAKSSALSIRYDAEAKSYALTVDSRSEGFGTADISERDAGDTVYRRVDSSRGETLALVSIPYTAKTGNKYVAMGFWQSSTLANDRQSTEFTTFTYGLPTASEAIPRTGAAAFGIDVFGLVTKPGEEPMSFQGNGKFSVDFAQGIFTAQASTNEYGLVTDKSVSGGGIELLAGGSLSSTNGTFSGNAVYGSFYGQAAGSIAGRFYGPAAQELGATFQTANSAGMAAVGSVVGALDPSQKSDNQTLTGLKSEQRFFTLGGGGYSIGNLTWLNSETFDYGPPSSGMAGGRFSISDKIEGADLNFNSYVKNVDDGYLAQRVTLDLYKPGAANTELALTYASFGRWTGTERGATQEYYFTYGFKTGSNFLAARTGKARYEGVAYGSGQNSDASARYDVKGTAKFDVDFGAQALGGALSLAGTERTTRARADFGSVDVTGKLTVRNSSVQADISRGTSRLGSLVGEFFGSNGQEMAGTFYFNAPAGSGEAREVGLQGAFATKQK